MGKNVEKLTGVVFHESGSLAVKPAKASFTSDLGYAPAAMMQTAFLDFSNVNFSALFAARLQTHHQPKQKLYCFVDETGQDDRSDYFIVVAVVSSGEQQELKEALLQLEHQSKIGLKKWHKLRTPEREVFLEMVINTQLAQGEVFFGRYRKPLPYFLPMLETLARAIQIVAVEDYKAVVYVDGIDKKKARELTNALRLKGIKAKHVRSARDESEPLIRLADRWAGCIRSNFEGNVEAKKIMAQAIEIKYLREV